MAGNQLPNLTRIFREDDEPDFLPSGGSNLAAIFGMQGKTQETAPSAKQTQKKSSTVHSAQPVPISKPEVIIAAAIYAYKLQNGSYGSVGKLGLALTGDIVAKTYQLILYKSKQEHVSFATVTHDFVYTIQENNYCSYYDTNKNNWTILFENAKTRDEFTREIGLARYFSKGGKLDSVFYQDITPVGKTDVAKEGDKIHINYFIATEIVQPFKNSGAAMQTMTIEISTDDSWERVLLGSNKGLKRILFLPPSKQISLGPGFPKEKDVMMEIEILDIVTEAAKATGAKASIIQRMAKMGQSMLPKPQTSTTTDSEDTEDDVPLKSPRHKKVDALGVAMQNKTVVQESNEETYKNAQRAIKPKSDLFSSEVTTPKTLVSAAFAHQWSPTQMQSNYVTMDRQLYPLQSQPMPQAIPTVIDPSLNMFLSETRMANTELRMGMSKIADNVQKLLDKFHVLELQNASTPATEKIAVDATLKMLLAMNTQNGTKDGESRKHEGQDVHTGVDSSFELNEMRNKVSTLEKEIQRLQESLASSKEYIKDLEAEKESLILVNKMSQVKIEKLENSLMNANDMLQRTRKDVENAMLQNSQYERENPSMEGKISKSFQERSAFEKSGNN